MAPLPPISIASVVIGFISFGFTLAIWLHAFVSYIFGKSTLLFIATPNLGTSQAAMDQSFNIYRFLPGGN
jgi:hypothetical protein